MCKEYYRVRLTDEAKSMLLRLGKKYGKKTYEILRDRINELEFDPDKRGIPLQRALTGLFSLHYSRFRVIYRIEKNQAEVLVIAAGYHESGSRSDIYKIVERLVKSGEIIIKDRPRKDS